MSDARSPELRAFAAALAGGYRAERELGADRARVPTDLARDSSVRSPQKLM